MSKSIKHPDNEPIETMPKDVFDTPNKIEFYLKQCHNTDCDNNENGFCRHGVIFTSYKCTEYHPSSDKHRKRS